MSSSSAVSTLSSVTVNVISALKLPSTASCQYEPRKLSHSDVRKYGVHRRLPITKGCVFPVATVFDAPGIVGSASTLPPEFLRDSESLSASSCALCACFLALYAATPPTIAPAPATTSEAIKTPVACGIARTMTASPSFIS